MIEGEPSPPSAARGIPRSLECLAAAVGLVLSAPILAVAALMVRASSPGPVLFHQERVGRGGRRFALHKLRTMRHAEEGPLLTAGGDDRVTPVGRILRKAKLDELPQLWNVLRGDMSLVGPRPEVPGYVDLQDPLWRETLRVRPGITDPVTLGLRDEETVLAGVAGDRERFYREELQPAKLRGYVAYARSRSLSADVRVLFRTVLAVLFPGSVGKADLASIAQGEDRDRTLSKTEPRH